MTWEGNKRLLKVTPKLLISIHILVEVDNSLKNLLEWVMANLSHYTKAIDKSFFIIEVNIISNNFQGI